MLFKIRYACSEELRNTLHNKALVLMAPNISPTQRCATQMDVEHMPDKLPLATFSTNTRSQRSKQFNMYCGG
jgi:hypothetical protein